MYIPPQLGKTLGFTVLRLLEIAIVKLGMILGFPKLGGRTGRGSQLNFQPFPRGTPSPPGILCTIFFFQDDVFKQALSLRGRIYFNPLGVFSSNNVENCIHIHTCYCRTGPVLLLMDKYYETSLERVMACIPFPS